MPPSPDLADFKIHIESTRIVLETLTPDNMSENYLSWLQNPEVLKYLEIRHAPPKNIDELKKFVLDMFHSSNNILAGIFIKETGIHIGNIKLGPIDKTYQRADMGIMIGNPTFWGKGYAGEAIKTMSQFSFKTLRLRRIQAGAYAQNRGSINAFLRAGFVQEGTLRSHWVDDNDQLQDNIIMGLLESDHIPT